VPRGGHVLLDARTTDYIDPDVLDLIHEYNDKIAPARGVELSLLGFHSRYPELRDRTQYVDYSTRELQDAATPQQVLEILKAGHKRFQSGNRLTRDLARQVDATAEGQHPLAVVLSCIDSRTPAELIFDLGMGDIFSTRVAGNVVGGKVLGSIEYACAVAGAKLILVMGHTRCGAVTAAVRLTESGAEPEQATGCQHIGHIVRDIEESVDLERLRGLGELPKADQEALIDEVARRHVAWVVRTLPVQSRTVGDLVRDGKIAIVGAVYDVTTGGMEFLDDSSPAT
jgi:carbonic anhydrase